jgi:protein-S-isoprenylcysteine O-methyltransferase Ste14
MDILVFCRATWVSSSGRLPEKRTAHLCGKQEETSEDLFEHQQDLNLMVDSRLLVKKAIGVPFVFLFMNSLFIVYAPYVFAGLTTLVPISLMSIAICIDVAIRPISAKPDRYSRNLLALAFLLFPFAVALPYFEFKSLTSVYLSSFMPVVLTVGIFALLVGWMILLVSRLQIGRYGGPRITIEDDHRLITNGMYRFIRNPQYLGMLLILSGYAFSLGSLIITAMIVICLLAILRNRIRLEEELLIAAFGDEYREYMRRTWRLFPHIY